MFAKKVFIPLLKLKMLINEHHQLDRDILSEHLTRTLVPVDQNTIQYNTVIIKNLEHHQHHQNIFSEHLTRTLGPVARRQLWLATLGERLQSGWTSIKVFIQGNLLMMMMTVMIAVI